MDSNYFMRFALKLSIIDDLAKSAEEIQRNILISILFNEYDSHLTANQIKLCCKEIGLTCFHEEQIETLLNDDSRCRIFRPGDDCGVAYGLQPQAHFSMEEEYKKKRLQNYIDEFAKIRNVDDQENFQNTLYQFLYHIANTNLREFQRIANPDIRGYAFPDSQLALKYSNEEKALINDFLNWDNQEKNELIYRLANIGLEFSMLSNPVNYDQFSQLNIKRKKFFLDTNIIYRLIGLNGDKRKNRITEFIENCNKTNQELFVSSYTECEFFDSIDYHCNHLQKFATTNTLLFNEFASSEDFYSFYYSWLEQNYPLGIKAFKSHLHTLFESLLSTYNIKRVLSPIDHNDRAIAKAINNQARRIAEYKQKYDSWTGMDEFDLIPQDAVFDSKNIYLVQEMRGSNNINFAETEYFFITTDQKLQDWNNKTPTQLVCTLLPSNWLSISIRFLGSADNDYKNFVTFINLPNHNSVITNDKLVVILAAIEVVESKDEARKPILKALLEQGIKEIIESKKPDAVYNATVSLVQKIQKDLLSQKMDELDEANFQVESLRHETESAQRSTQENEIKYSHELAEKNLKLAEKDEIIRKLEENQQAILESKDRNKTITKNIIFLCFELSYIGFYLFWIINLLFPNPKYPHIYTLINYIFKSDEIQKSIWSWIITAICGFVGVWFGKNVIKQIKTLCNIMKK